ncbi:MAG: hypothetical protein AB7W37_05640 [Syntrophobacteraceae bacterium]
MTNLAEKQTQHRTETALHQALLQQGLQQGFQKGHRQGVRDGELKAQRAAVLRALEARFGAPSTEMAQEVRTIEESQILDALHVKAVTAISIDEFQRALEDRR